MTASDPVTAHGWTVYPDCITHVAAHLTTTNQLGRPGPRAGLARCIEDAALLAEAREMAAALHRGENIFTGQVDDIHRLLALLSGDGTP